MPIARKAAPAATPRKTAPRKTATGTVQGGRDDGRETVILQLGDLSVVFKKPIGGQMAALKRVGTLFGSSDKVVQAKGGMLFLEVADALVSDGAMLDRVYSGLADESIPLEDYANCVIELIEHFIPDADEAPANGPVSTRKARVKR